MAYLEATRLEGGDQGEGRDAGEKRAEKQDHDNHPIDIPARSMRAKTSGNCWRANHSNSALETTASPASTAKAENALYPGSRLRSQHEITIQDFFSRTHAWSVWS